MSQTLNGRAPYTVTPHTAGATLTGNDNGTMHSNAGATGAIVLALPPATPGLHFYFHVMAAQELRIDPNLLQTIGLPSTGVQGGAGKYLTADAIGEWVHLVCVAAGAWTVQGFAGTWTAEA